MHIIGNIKINEFDNKRVQYFFASLLSLNFIPDAKIGLTLTQPSNELMRATGKLLRENFDQDKQQYIIHKFDKTEKYSDGINVHLRKLGSKELYLNFEEDHFCVLNNIFLLKKIIAHCVLYQVDVLRASYWPVEHASIEKVVPINKNPEDDGITAFFMDIPGLHNFNAKFKRYFIGSNSFFTKQMAQKIYNKPGCKPHDFEMMGYKTELSHVCAVPEIEILRSIDNDNEFTGSCLLSNPTDKFNYCMNKAEQYLWQ